MRLAEQHYEEVGLGKGFLSEFWRLGNGGPTEAGLGTVGMGTVKTPRDGRYFLAGW